MTISVSINKLVHKGYNPYFSGIMKVTLVKNKLRIERFFRDIKTFDIESIVGVVSYQTKDGTSISITPGVYSARFLSGHLISFDEYIEPRKVKSFDDLKTMLTSGISV